MGEFDKKKVLSIGGILTGLASIIAILANLSEIGQFFHKDEPKMETSTSIVEMVEKTTEQAEEKIVEEVPETESPTEPPTDPPTTEPPTEPQPAVTYLSDMKVSKSQYFYYDEEETKNSMDTVGNTYKNNVLTIGEVSEYNDYGYEFDDNYATYYLGGKYKKLNGTISVNDISLNKGSGELSILLDDEVIYTTGKSDREFEPYEFPEPLNVEGGKWLKIVLTNNNSWSLTGKCSKRINFILSDFRLE